MKVCSNDPCHLTKMAAMPIYGVNLLKMVFSKTNRPMTFELCIQLWGLEPYKVCSNDEPGLTLTCFIARSNLLPYAFVWENA